MALPAYLSAFATVFVILGVPRATQLSIVGEMSYRKEVAALSPFANVLHTETIAKLARSSVLERGRSYVSRVTHLALTEGRLAARVQGAGLYRVAIWVKGDRLGYVCSCPAGEAGEFCKHCVAVALAWVDRATPTPSPAR